MLSPLGILAAGVAFACVGTLFYWGFNWGSNEAVIPAAIAGCVAYLNCPKKDVLELRALCNPPEELWPISLPHAWGTVIEVLRQNGYESQDVGLRTWEDIKEDDSRGIITAVLRFTDKHYALELDINKATEGQMIQRGISIKVTFVPDEATDGTKVTFVYTPHMQKGDNTAVRNVIKNMRKKFPKTMLIKKKELGL